MTRLVDLETIVLQAIGEADKGLRIAEGEAKRGQLASCRETIRTVRRVIAVLDEAVPALLREPR